MATIEEYEKFVGELNRSLASIARRLDIATEIAYYLDHVGVIASVDEFQADDRVCRFALKAFGLHDLNLGMAFIRAALTAGGEGSGSFSLHVSDSRLRELAATFDFRRFGAAATAQPAVLRPVVDRYLHVELEALAGQSDEGLKLALHFRRRAPCVAGVYGLFADPALSKVVEVALGLPPARTRAGVEMEAKAVAAMLNDGFDEAASLRAFIALFLDKWRASKTADAADLPRISFGREAWPVASPATLLSLQDLKPSGVA